MTRRFAKEGDRTANSRGQVAMEPSLGGDDRYWRTNYVMSCRSMRKNYSLGRFPRILRVFPWGEV